MTTSQRGREGQLLSEIVEGKEIPVRKLAYFRSRTLHEVYDLALDEFDKLESDGKITKAELARRIGRKPEQITRWLGAPGNWTFETYSDLLLGMGFVPTFGKIRVAELASANAKVIEVAAPKEATTPTAPLVAQANNANTVASIGFTTRIVLKLPLGRATEKEDSPKIEARSAYA